MRILICLALVFVSSLSVGETHRLASQRNIVFDRIGTEDGLSQAFATTFTQDKHGYVWIGTQEGLNRFDGFKFVSYYQLDGDASSLSHDAIWALLSDSSGRLWVGTDEGLNFFHHDTRTFEQLQLGDSEQPRIHYLHEDMNGDIWVGSSDGLYRLNTAQVPIAVEFFPLIPSGVRALERKSSQEIWIGTERHGLFVVNVDTGTVLESERSKALPDQHIRDLLQDQQGNLWIGTYNGGLVRFGVDGDRVSQFSSRAGAQSLASNRVRTLFEDRDGRVWIGTDTGLQLHLNEDRFVTFQHDMTNPRSLSDNSVVDIFQDRGGVIWVGTFNGVSKWNADLEVFPYFKRPILSLAEASSNHITSFVESGSGDVWVGTFSGLLHWDSVNGVLDALPVSETGLDDQRVMSLGLYADQVWAGTMASGVNVLENNRVVQRFKNDPYDSTSLSANAITGFYIDSEQRQWVTTWGGGVNLYLGNGSFKRYPDETMDRTQFPDLRCMDIVEVSPDEFWIATYGGGIVVLDLAQGTATPHEVTSNGVLTSKHTISLLRTHEGVWVGTLDRGLSLVRNDGTVTNFSKKDGLASDAVYGMLEDEYGNVWVSGAKGLTKISRNSDDFVQFDSTHGLQSSDFNSGAYAKFSDGSLAFGGNNGFNVFYPDRIGLNEYRPEVLITDIKLFNEPLDLGTATEDTFTTAFAHDDSVISFEFAALDYTAPHKNLYRYRLEGFDRDWVNHGNNREATYTNLDAGRYVFRVQGSNNDGVWNRDGAALEVVVSPAPWLTWWAFCIYFSIAVGALYALFRFNTEQQKIAAEREYSEQLRLYIESLEEATDCIVIADARGSVLYVNNAMTETLGEASEEVVGRLIWDVLFEQEEDVATARDMIKKESRYHGEVRISHAAAQPVTHEVTIAAVQPGDQQKAAFFGISRDVTQRKITEAELEDYRKNLEQLVEERTQRLQKEILENKAIQEDLAESLQEKELFIKEVHHRVKNNMQVISSLLSIQAEGAGDDKYSNLLHESQQRIKSMALIHENLYQSKDLLEIDFQEYIETLTTSLSRSYTQPGVQVVVDVTVEDVALDLETAVPCGLIINELVSNSLKHAFRVQNGLGKIAICFRTVGCNYELTIRDDGIGLPEHFDPKQNTSMGMEIVSILTLQLEGELEAHNDCGAVFSIRFPRYPDVHG